MPIVEAKPIEDPILSWKVITKSEAFGAWYVLFYKKGGHF